VERTRPFLTDVQVPVLWYFTRGTIGQQARTIIREAIPHGHMWLGYTNIHVMWMLSSHNPADTEVHRISWRLSMSPPR